MAYFDPYIDAEGIHIPTYDDRMEYFQSEYKRIFGDDIYLGEETPDYQLLSVFSRCLDDMAALAVDAYNARNPYYAAGNSLDVLLALVGLNRKRATYSKVILTIKGEPRTSLPEGALAIDQVGYLWALDEAVTIPEEGSIDVPATCRTAGAIPAGIGTIDGIFSPTAGWESVINAAEAEMGLNKETDAEFRQRHAASHVKQNNGLKDAILAQLLSLDDVAFATIAVNDTNETDERGIPGHSICATVTGGEDEDIADVIYKNKSPGAGTFGNTSCTVDDGSGGTATVRFSRTSEVPVSVTINVSPNGRYSEDFNLRIRACIMADINSLGIGNSWKVSMGFKDIYSAFEQYGYPFTVTSIQATNVHGTSSLECECLYNEILTVAEEDITIVVGS